MRVKVTNRTEITLSPKSEYCWIISDPLKWGYEIDGGECCVYIFVTTWQSGDVFITIIVCRCDDCTVTVSRLLGGSDADLTEGLNQLIIEAGIDW